MNSSILVNGKSVQCSYYLHIYFQYIHRPNSHILRSKFNIEPVRAHPAEETCLTRSLDVFLSSPVFSLSPVFIFLFARPFSPVIHLLGFFVEELPIVTKYF